MATASRATVSRDAFATDQVSARSSPCSWSRTSTSTPPTANVPGPPSVTESAAAPARRSTRRAPSPNTAREHKEHGARRAAKRWFRCRLACRNLPLTTGGRGVEGARRMVEDDATRLRLVELRSQDGFPRAIRFAPRVTLVTGFGSPERVGAWIANALAGPRPEGVSGVVEVAGRAMALGDLPATLLPPRSSLIV